MSLLNFYGYLSFPSYCLDLHLQSNRTVAIRDGAYSNFDTSKVVDPMNPIAQLKVSTSPHALFS